MRATILILALVALVASANGSSIADRIKEKLTPSSMQEHQKKPEQQLPQQLPSSSFDQQQQNIQRENLPQQQQNIPRENLPQQQQRGFVQPQQQDIQKLPQQQQQHGFMQQPQSARSGEFNVEQKRMEQQRMPENVDPNLPMPSGRQEYAQEQMNPPKMDQKNVALQQPSDIRQQGQHFETSQQQPKLKSQQAFGSNPRDVADQQTAGQTWWGTRTYQYSWPTYSPRYVWPQYQYPVYHSHPGGDQPHYHVPGGGMYYY